jgi:hypothetical protein
MTISQIPHWLTLQNFMLKKFATAVTKIGFITALRLRCENGNGSNKMQRPLYELLFVIIVYRGYYFRVD